MFPVLYCIVKNDSIYTPTETTVYERVTDGVEQEASISSHAIESYWTPWRNKHTDRQTPYVNGDSVPVFLLYLPRCFLEFSGVGNKNTIIVMVVTSLPQTILPCRGYLFPDCSRFRNLTQLGNAPCLSWRIARGN